MEAEFTITVYDNRSVGLSGKGKCTTRNYSLAATTILADLWELDGIEPERIAARARNCIRNRERVYACESDETERIGTSIVDCNGKCYFVDTVHDAPHDWETIIYGSDPQPVTNDRNSISFAKINWYPLFVRSYSSESEARWIHGLIIENIWDYLDDL